MTILPHRRVTLTIYVMTLPWYATVRVMHALAAAHVMLWEVKYVLVLHQT